MNRYTSICIACAHLRFGPDGGRCDAFPHGIPDDIASGMYDHRVAHVGDNGVRFRLREGFEEALAMFESSYDFVARDRRKRFYVIDGGEP